MAKQPLYIVPKMEEKRTFEELMREVFGPAPQEDIEDERADLSDEAFGLTDEEDTEILMHRDAHFGGRFDVMLDYYRGEGKGVCQDISLERIERLYEVERVSGQDLASFILSGAEAEKIARVRKAYQVLQKIGEMDAAENRHPQLITELILTEDEDATHEIEAIVAEGAAMVPSLLQLVQAREFYDPLYPGYGYAPALAAKCLGLIKDPSTIAPLFEAIDSGDFFDEEDIFHALYEIGPEARDFLIRLVVLRPMTLDNERAARALTHFAMDPKVSVMALRQLDDPEVARHSNLAAYLILCCEGLQAPADRAAFAKLADREGLDQFRQDIRAIIKEWH